MNEPTLADVLAALSRVEHKLDTLVQALAEDDEEAKPITDLDGATHGVNRDPLQSLDP